MTLRYTITPGNHIKPYLVTKKVDNEKQAKRLMNQIKKVRPQAGDFKLYDPMENRFVEIEK